VQINYFKDLDYSYLRVSRKKRNSVNSRAWLQRFDDITGVEKICVAKGINGKKAKEKYFIIAN